MKVLEAKLENNNWTNGMYKLVLDVSELPKTTEKVLFEDEKCKLVYGENEYGFVTYGSISKVASFGHQAGYRWSSRASVFNGTFQKECMEITLVHNGSRHCGSMQVQKALEYLPNEFYIIEQIKIYEDTKEISYYISNKEHEMENDWLFEDTECTEYKRYKRYISNRIYPHNKSKAKGEELQTDRK